LCPKTDATLPSLLYSLLDAVVEANLVGRLLSFLSPEEDDEQEQGRDQNLVIASAWIIATLARTEPKLLVVDKDAIGKLLNLLSPETSSTAVIPVAYALSALATTSGGSDKRLYVNYLRDAGVIPALIKMIRAALDELSLNVCFI
jgi:hypothetical protein